MNQKEKQYALDRVSAIAQAKVEAIKKKFTTDGTVLTGAQRLAALKKGAFKVRADVAAVHPYSDIHDVITFDGDKPGSKDEARIASETAKVNAEATRIKDKLMLGDSKEALALIEKFAA